MMKKNISSYIPLPTKGLFWLIQSVVSLILFFSFELSASDKVAKNSQNQSYKTNLVNNTGTNASDIDLHNQIQPIEQYFDRIISGIDSNLLDKRVILKKDKKQLIEFVESNILPFWDLDQTTKMLIGKDLWSTYKLQEKNALIKRFEQTLHRYVQEGINHYDGQRVKLESVELGKRNNRGLITLTLEPIYLPPFKVYFRIVKKQEQWRLYDIVVKGVSYIKMKKNEYRQLAHSKGLQGLLQHIDAKNKL